MGGANRRNRLAISAYTAGILDYSRSDRYSPLWELKREIVFGQLEEDNLTKLKALRAVLHASASAYGTPELFEHHFNNGVSAVKGVGELLFPWIDWESDPKAEEYRKLWESWFGIEVGSPEWEAIEKQGELMDEIYTAQGRGKKVIDA